MSAILDEAAAALLDEAGAFVLDELPDTFSIGILTAATSSGINASSTSP